MKLGLENLWAENSSDSSISLFMGEKAQDVGLTEGTMKAQFL